MSVTDHSDAPEVSGTRLTSLEVCAGAGGLALGLEQAGFDPLLLLDNRSVACQTLRMNRPDWDVFEGDLLEFDPIDAQHVYDVDLLVAGLPRLKATAAVSRTRDDGSELGLVKATVMLAYGVQPRAILIDNVPDLVTSSKYAPLREYVEDELTHLGYTLRWLVVNAADYGVPQDRKHGILVAFKENGAESFEVPAPRIDADLTVGNVLYESMSAGGWSEAVEWAAQANRLAPTLVGGSWERGGPDLGPTGSKTAWARMGVDAGTVADRVPGSDFVWIPDGGRDGLVKLTVDQAAILQGFPSSWNIAGRKTARYRQVGNAMPPPLARMLGSAIRKTLS
ncbi:DNA cytosine methyltransferase [Rhodococcus sp. W8901]|uniref:DNA cytosine methyltransferase n=1 Tax=Rhodococcus sp. W8901 TaxID=2742603 RepID=UPI0015837902|nr:DNA cytosine methyltransferase [Rhodococcus sp. W8901]QKT14048.1 DNA cytosine methyltransferase [Rhodococcus sp. W8901]